MKREDLKALGLEDEVVDSVMALHGKDIEATKASLTQSEKSVEDLKGQLTEANKTIEGFKKMDIEAIKQSADDWKTKAEQFQAEAEKNIQALKFDHALENALSGAKAKDADLVKAKLNLENLKLNEADGSIVGLEDQLKGIKESHDYLFDSEDDGSSDDGGSPTVVKGAASKKVNMSALTSAVMKGAGIKPE